MEAARDGQQQVVLQLQAAQEELSHTKEALLTAQSAVEPLRMQLARCTRELSESGMQRFELSQTLQDTQAQLAAQIELSNKMQIRARKHEATQASLRNELEVVQAALASSVREHAESTRTQQQVLLDSQQQLEAARRQAAQADEAQAVLQQQVQQAEIERQQVCFALYQECACISHTLYCVSTSQAYLQTACSFAVCLA